MRDRNKGATLIELAVAITVLAICTTIALPSMGALVTQQRASAVANRVLGMLYAGRTAAVVRGRTVVLCPSTDATTCATGGRWSDGVLARVEPRRRGQAPTILRTMQPEDMEGLHLVASAGRSQLSFLRNGRAAGSNQTLTLCDRQGQALRQIIVNNGGRARVQVPPNGTRCAAAQAEPAAISP